jgi:hypothetical protein
MKCNPWISKMGVGHGANDLTPEKFIVTKTWRRCRHTQGCSAIKEVENELSPPPSFH